jgi:dolichyl-phosphate beta-glucosyltransferase
LDRASADVGNGRRITLLPRPGVDLELIIPAYNEERRIGKTIEHVLRYLERQTYAASIAVVDNGSVDRTVDAAAEWAGASRRVQLHLLNCARRGKGAAIRAGILSSSSRTVGFSDADLATPIETLDRVYPLLAEGAPIVIASRRENGARYHVPQPLTRRLGSEAFRRTARLVVDGISDTQCGFKFFQRDVARRLFEQLTIDAFAFDVEILGLAQHQGLQVQVVPADWTDSAGSTFRAFPDGIVALGGVLKTWWRLRANSVEGVDGPPL